MNPKRLDFQESSSSAQASAGGSANRGRGRGRGRGRQRGRVSRRGSAIGCFAPLQSSDQSATPSDNSVMRQPAEQSVEEEEETVQGLKRKLEEMAGEKNALKEKVCDLELQLEEKNMLMK